MESNNVPKGFEKFKIFRDLITDIALLIKNLEQNLKIKLNQNKPSNSSLKDNLAKSTLGSRIKKIWPFRGVFEAHRASLSDYLEYNNNINKFLDEIVLENTGKFNLIEQYDQIADIINKFKIDASCIFRKYSQQLQPEYDRERENFIKNKGIPDPVSDKEIEDAHRASSGVGDSVARNKTEIGDDLVEKLLTFLIKKDLNLDRDEEEINKELANFGIANYQLGNLLSRIRNYDVNKKWNIIKENSPKIIKGGKEKWQEVVNKNFEEFMKNWPNNNEDPSEVLDKLNYKKANQMSDLEKLQYTLISHYEEEEFDEFLSVVRDHPSDVKSA